MQITEKLVFGFMIGNVVKLVGLVNMGQRRDMILGQSITKQERLKRLASRLDLRPEQPYHTRQHNVKLLKRYGFTASEIADSTGYEYIYVWTVINYNKKRGIRSSYL